MVYKKGPDWQVWVGDIWHWASSTPQNFIIIIILMGGALYYTTTHPQMFTTRPAITNVPPAVQQGQQQSSLKNNCPPDYIFLNRINGCTPIINHQWYTFEANNTVRISRPFTTRVRAGRAQFISNNQTYILTPQNTAGPQAPAFQNATITTLDPLTSVGFQFSP